MSAPQHRVEKIEVGVSKWAREIAAKRAFIMALVGSILAPLVILGFISTDDSARIAGCVTAAIGFLSTVGAGLWIRKSTTTADPKLGPLSIDLEPLVPDPELQATVESFEIPEGDNELADLMTS